MMHPGTRLITRGTGSDGLSAHPESTLHSVSTARAMGLIRNRVQESLGMSAPVQFRQYLPVYLPTYRRHVPKTGAYISRGGTCIGPLRGYEQRIV